MTCEHGRDGRAGPPSLDVARVPLPIGTGRHSLFPSCPIPLPSSWLHATKRFGSLTALDDVSVAVRQAKSVAHARTERRREDDGGVAHARPAPPDPRDGAALRRRSASSRQRDFDSARCSRIPASRRCSPCARSSSCSVHSTAGRSRRRRPSRPRSSATKASRASPRSRVGSASASTSRSRSSAIPTCSFSTSRRSPRRRVAAVVLGADHAAHRPRKDRPAHDALSRGGGRARRTASS